MIVIVVSPIGTLVGNQLEPVAGAIAVLREVERLGIPSLMAADLPRALLEDVARVVAFKGEIIASPRPLADVRSASVLPPECFWWVTADKRQMRAAQRAGYNVAGSLDALLPLIREPYVRATLAVRHVIDDMFVSARTSDSP